MKLTTLLGTFKNKQIAENVRLREDNKTLSDQNGLLKDENSRLRVELAQANNLHEQASSELFDFRDSINKLLDDSA